MLENLKYVPRSYVITDSIVTETHLIYSVYINACVPRNATVHIHKSSSLH